MREGEQVRRREWLALAAATALAFVPASVNAADATPGAAEKIFAIDITAGKTPPAQQVIRVEKNDLVKLRISSDTAGDVHLHAYRKDVKLVPGTSAEISFKAHATGRFRIEWHAVADKNTKGDTKSDAKASAHHAPPLAILEVRPK